RVYQLSEGGSSPTILLVRFAKSHWRCYTPRASAGVVDMDTWDHNVRHFSRLFVVSLLFLLSPAVWPQVAAPKPPAAEAAPEIPKDTLGRNTPRGAVLGFLSAVRKGNAEIAVLYLNTPLRGAS